MIAIGVDIGGTKLLAAAVDDTGAILCTEALPTRAREGPDAVLGQCQQAVERVQQKLGTAAVVGLGVASAGRIEPKTGKVLFSTDTFRNWRGTEIRSVLANHFSCPVFADNDVNAALLGEVWIGGGQGCTRLALVALGTGVGGALWEAGQLSHGANCSAGEFGHMLYTVRGRLCGCGARGCYESYLAGPALEADYRERSGNAKSAKAILHAYSQGEADAVAVVEQWVQCLAALLYSLQNGFDPECILLDGGVGDSAHLWQAALERELHTYPIPVAVQVAMLGNRAALVGAARMVFDRI